MMRHTLTLILAIASPLALAACDKDSDKKSSEPTTAPKTGTAPDTTVPAPQPPEDRLGPSLKEAVGDYTIDPAHTRVLFKILHLGASYQYGMFTRVDGKLTIAADPTRSSVEISVPADSVFTAIKKRDDHLRSPDFFDAKQFPTIRFKSKSIEATGGNKYALTGELDMHGVKRDVTINLEHVGAARDPEAMGGGFRVGFNGETVIKRSQWNMSYMQGAGLGDEVTLLLSLEATRKE